MPFTSYLEYKGKINAAAPRPDAQLFLLNEEGRVLARRNADPASPAVGEAFLAGFDGGEKEREALRRALPMEDRPILLLPAGRPVLAIRSLFARTRFFPLLLPRGEVAELLRAPGYYANEGSFEDLTYSLAAALRIVPPSEADYMRMRDWLGAATDAFLLSRIAVGSDACYPVMIVEAARRLALLTGVSLSFDFSDMGSAPIPDPDVALFTAVLYWVLLDAPESGVSLIGERGGDLSCKVHILFAADEAEDVFFSRRDFFAQEALERGLAFSFCREEGRVHLSFPLSRRRYDAQGVKQPANFDFYDFPVDPFRQKT